MLLTVALLFVNLLSSIFGAQLHDYMTKEEKESIFRVDHDQVHNVQYAIVPIIKRVLEPPGRNGIGASSSNSHFEKHSIYLNVFGENFNLYLEENDNVLYGDRTPIIKPYMARGGKIKYDVRDYNLIPALKMGAYHDRQNRAALTMYEDENGRTNVNGIINDTIVIRSLPERLHTVLDENSNLLVPLNNNEVNESYNHIVMRQDVQSNSNNVRFNPTHSQSEKEGLLHRKKRGLRLPWTELAVSPANYKEFTAYPKILVVLDHATYLLNHNNLAECVRYTLAYWNVVDLRYREMEKPHIRLNIAGIIIATEPGITPYMEEQKASADSRYSEEALHRFEDFFAKENVTNVDYDIVVGLSPWRLVDRTRWFRPVVNLLKNTRFDDSSIFGISYYATICKRPRRAMALVRDKGNFNGNIAAHEIAHILGVSHDPEDLAENNPDYKSHWKHGFLMSYASENKNQMHWSDLSIREMQKFLQKTVNNHCLLQKPIVGTPYRKILPGKIIDRNEQCKILLGQSSYSAKRQSLLSDCMSQYCYSIQENAYAILKAPVMEGTTCGDKKICIEGDCVDDHTDSNVYQNLLDVEGLKKYII